MITEVWDFNTYFAARLKYALPSIDRIIDTIDVYFYLLRFHFK